MKRVGGAASGDIVCKLVTFDWMCCHGSPIELLRDVCRNTKSAPGSNTAPRRCLVLGSTTCTYHARQTLNVYSRTRQRLRPRYTNSIIYASINIRAAHSSLHSFNVRIHSTFIYSLAQLLSSRFCVLNFSQTELFWSYNNFNLVYSLCSCRSLNSYNIIRVPLCLSANCLNPK
jgi:hypothetical protein